MAELGHPLFPARQIPDALEGKDVSRYLRLVYDDVGSAFARQQQDILGDPRFGDERTANALASMQGPIYGDKCVQPKPGQVLYAIDEKHYAFGDYLSPAPTGGGLPPLVGAAHRLLDGVFNSDTVARTPVLGDLIYATAAPAWDRLSGNTTATRKFLRQVGTGAVSAAPAWDTLVAGDIPALSAAAGWTDDGTVVRLTTSTDQVGIGTATPSACLGIVNVNNVADTILKLTAKASQSGNCIELFNSAGREMVQVDEIGGVSIGTYSDATKNAVLGIGTSEGTLAPHSPSSNHAIITWGSNGNALSAPTCTADSLGCLGARIYTYKDATGQYDAAYGQDVFDAWVLPGPEDITYSIWTGGLPASVTPYLRGQWAGNGDYTNYGLVHVRKSLGAVTKGIPSLRLEETAAGTGYLDLRAPAVVTGAAQIQLLQNVVGTFVMVGDDPPAVASKALGKVDSTGLSAAVASTNLTNSAAAGMYLIDYTLLDTTADVTAGTIQLSIAYTDTVGATTQTSATVALTATGRTSGQIVVQLASGEISYSTALVGIIGSARYALYIRVVALG